MNRRPASSSILRAAKGLATGILAPAALVAVASVRLQAPERERLGTAAAPPGEASGRAARVVRRRRGLDASGPRRRSRLVASVHGARSASSPSL